MITRVRLESPRDSLFEQAFALYKTSFPLHEQRQEDRQAALLANPLYHFDAVLVDGGFAGILLYWEFPDYTYIEHFAIDPARRGGALGSGCLAAFCEGRPLVVLEIDPPVDEISVRREGFYKRLGFRSNPNKHTHPAYRVAFPPHELVVMSAPRALDESEYATFARDLRETVMKDAAPPRE